uniref:LolU n=1 Tax=Epichloe aotearoae TaxID=170559 RepID=R9W3X8_EPIAO|nr:LolU [Epichloe aotearoae]
MVSAGNHAIVAPGWTTSEDGTLTRPLDLVENWLLARIQRANTPPGREAEGLTYKLKLRLPQDIDDPIPYLRRAWLVFRYVQPLIGAIYPPFSERDETGRYLVTVPPMDPEEWLRLSFHVNQGSQAVFRDVDDAGKIFRPRPTAMAYWFPPSSTLVIRSTHLRFDAVGLYKATNTFMLGLESVFRLGLDANLDCYTTDVKQPSLPPGIDYILGFPPQETPVSHRVECAVDELMRHWHHGLYSLSLPVREGSEDAAPANTQHMVTLFDEPTLEAIVAGCKELGVSVSAAVHASIVRVWASFPQQQHTGARNMLIPLVANLRPLLDPKWVVPDYALSLCIFVVPFCLTGGFEDLTQRLGAVYSRDLSALPSDPAGDPMSFLELLPLYDSREAAFLGSLPVAGCPPFRVPNLSSLGVLERYLARAYGEKGAQAPVCEIEDVALVNATTDPTIEFQLFTFRGTMRLYLYYNDAYYTEDSLASVMEMVRESLLQELGLDRSESSEGLDPKEA